MCGVCGKRSTGRTRLKLVAGLDQLRGVGRQRRRVAGDVDDPLRRGLDDPADDLLREARARRVDDRDVGLAGLLDQLAHREPDVAGEELRVGDVVEPGVLDRVAHRRLDELDADHLARPAGEREPDRADAAVEVEDALVPAQPGVLDGDAVEPLGHLGVGLEERLGRDQEVAGRRACRAAAGRRRAARSRRPGWTRRARSVCVQNSPSQGTASISASTSSLPGEVTRRTWNWPRAAPLADDEVAQEAALVAPVPRAEALAAALGEHQLAQLVAALGRPACSRSSGGCGRSGRARGSRTPARRRRRCRTSTRACCGSATARSAGTIGSCSKPSRRPIRVSASATCSALTSSWRS